MDNKKLKFFKIILLIIFASFILTQFLTPTFAKTYAKDASIKWPQEKSDLKADPNVLFGKLKNGFRYVLMKNKYPEDRTSLHLYVDVGSVDEKDNEQGLAHFLEHMLFCGTTHYKPGELVKYFQTIGMQFGPDANAHTGFYKTVYDLLLPIGDKKSLKKAFTVIKDYAQGALLLKSEIAREKKVILAEKRTRDSASYRTFVSTLKFELPNCIISKRLPIGIEKVIKNTNQKQLKAFYDTWYRPSNMVLVMVGDFNKKNTKKLISKYFSDMSPRAPPTPETIVKKTTLHKGLKTFYHYEKTAGNTDVTIETIKIIKPSNDSIKFEKAKLLKDISFMIMQNRLRELVRKPGSPFTKASSGSGIALKYIDYAAISANCFSKNWKKTLTLLEKELRKALLFGFNKREFDRVKKDYNAMLKTAVAKAKTRQSTHLSRQIISSINKNRVFQSPKQELKFYNTCKKTITLDAVNKAFRKCWPSEDRSGNRLILVTGNAKIKKGKLKPTAIIKDVYLKSQSKIVVKEKLKKKVNFPYLPNPETQGKIIDKKFFDDLKITQFTFANGVKLNIKKTKFKDNEVLACISFGSGKQNQPENMPGLSFLSENVINESGVKKLNITQLDRALAGKNTEVLFGVGERAFTIQGQTVTKEVELMFQLFYTYLKDMAFRKDAYKLVLNRYKQKYYKLLHTINGARMIRARRFLAGGDSRFGLPSYKDLSNLSISDINKWIKKPLAHDKLELSIVGDFDVNKVVNLASIYFGSLAKQNKLPKITNNKKIKFPNGKTEKIKVDTKIPKGIVIVAYPTQGFKDIHTVRRLSVLAEVFSNRLHEKIREEYGVAYSPYAYNYSSKISENYGLLSAIIEISPKDAKIASKYVKKIAKDIKKYGIKKAELKRALKPILTGIKDMRQNNAYWLNTVLADSYRYPEKIKWAQTITKDYSSITVDDIKKFANKYLDNKKAAIVVIEPKK